MKSWNAAAPLGVVLMLACVTAPAQAQASVQQVTVELTFDGVAPHRLIRDRLEATVLSVADRLLVGRPVDQVAALQPTPEATIAGVVERVATGYAVSALVVRPGATTGVAIRLRPIGVVMREVAVVLDLRSAHPRVQPLLTTLLRGGPVQEMQAVLAALPVGSLDWAGPLIALQAREAVEAALPGFTTTVHIRPGDVAELDLLLAPMDSRVIRNIGIRFRSSSIPIVWLDPYAPQVASMAEPLRGLPVAFADAHRPSLERLLNEELEAYAPTLRYRVVATARLEPAETTYITVTADSQVYRARVEAQLNIGARAPGPVVVAHLGRLITPPVEPFIEVRLVPTPLSITADLGIRLEVSPSTFVGATYAPSTQETTLWTTVPLGRDLGARGGWTMPTQVFEGAFTYRINEFLVWELVGTTRGDVWVRLVSNL